MGCGPNYQKQMDHDKWGELTPMSAFVLATVRINPVGKHVITFGFAYHDDAALAPVRDTLFIGPKIVDQTAQGARSLLTATCGHSIRFDLLNDTCTVLVMQDTAHSPTHFQACVGLLTEKFGEPTIDHSPTTESGQQGAVDHYAWKSGTEVIDATFEKESRIYTISMRRKD
jgi:hypothetical protein